MLFRRHHPIHRTVGISPGEGSGREPPPRQKEPYSPSTAAPAQERGFSWQEPGRGAAGGAGPIPPSTGISPYTALLSPPPRPRLRRSSPAPVGGGSSRDISGKAGQGRRPRRCPSPASSHTPDRGDITRGGAGEGTPSPSKRTIQSLHRGSRPGAGVLVARARQGRNRRSAGRGEATLIVRFTGISPYPALLFPHLSRAFGAPPPPGAGAVVAISPARAQARGRPAWPCLRWHHPTRRTVGNIIWGWGPGRLPHTLLSPTLPGASPITPEEPAPTPPTTLHQHPPTHRTMGGLARKTKPRIKTRIIIQSPLHSYPED